MTASFREATFVKGTELVRLGYVTGDMAGFERCYSYARMSGSRWFVAPLAISVFGATQRWGVFDVSKAQKFLGVFMVDDPVYTSDVEEACIMWALHRL